jgi:hypothetical protein
VSRDPQPAAPAVRRPLYARVLRLRHIHPSSVWCFVFFEGMIALGVLLALAELVNWWGVLVLPVAVAAMVKINDLLAGALARGGTRPAPPVSPAPPPPALSPEPATPPPPPRGTRQVSRDLSDSLDPADSPRQRFRQSARRRYR